MTTATADSGSGMGVMQTVLAVILGVVGAALVAWGLLQTSRPIEEEELQQDSGQKELFLKKYACPMTGKHTEICKGWVVGYIKPLCAGGVDRIANMQWQTVATAKRKEREAQKLCAKPSKR